MRKRIRSIINLLVFAALSINVLYLYSGIIAYGVASVDAYSIWLLKAKLIYFGGFEAIKSFNLYPYSHPQYPILLPLLLSAYSYILGSYNDLLILSIYPIIYTLILLIAYKLILQICKDKTYTLIFVYLYSLFSPLLAAGGRTHAGEADIFITLSSWLIIYFVYKYLQLGKIKYFLLISLIIAVASQIKSEGVLLISVLLILPLKVKSKVPLILLAVAPTFGWYVLQSKIGLDSDFDSFIAYGIWEIFSRGFTILVYTLKELINYKNWYLFWPLFFLVLLTSKKNLTLLCKLNLKFLCVYTFIIFGVYLFSEINAEMYVTSSLDRILLQVSPFFYLVFVEKITILLPAFRIKPPALK